MKLEVHIDPKAYSDKPPGNEIAGIKARLQKDSAPISVSLNELTCKIETGHSISPAVMSGMSAADWSEQQLFMVDIDNDLSDVPVISPEQAVEVCIKSVLPPAFYYFTFSHSRDKPKFRVAFIMDKVVNDPCERRIIMDVLVSLFKQSDKSCINADRIFLGTNKKAVILDENARISMEQVLAVYSPRQSETRFPANGRRSETADAEIDALKNSFDFLGYLIKRNGKYNESGNIIMFKNCEICGHKDNLRYYKDTNTFYCFSSSGEVGGSIIEYLMATEELTLKEAIDKLKYDLCDPEWQTPMPFEDFSLPSFPVEQLPKTLRDWVAAVAENTATTVDMAAVSALAVIASTVQGKFEIMGKADYIEPLNLYVLIIANPGERKSQIVKIMTKDIIQFEREENQIRQPQIERRQTEINVSRQKLEQATKKGETALAIKLKREISEMEADMPKFLRLIADNVTPEALTSLMADNNGVLSIFSTEGGLFEIFSGMYSKTGVNIDTLLKAHSGDPIRVDRKGRENEKIDSPALTMLLSVQENVLEGVLRNPAFIGRGLTARILYCIPGSLMGRRTFGTPAIPPELMESYKKLIYQLLKIPIQSNGRPYLLQLEPNAYTALEELFDWLEPQLVGDLSEMSGWGAKFIGMTLRIAGILHCARNNNAPYDRPVSADTMSRAIAIGKYFLEHARYTFSLMGADKAVPEAKYILKRLSGQKKVSLRSSEMQKLCKHFHKQEEMLPALELLMEYGYIKRRVGKKYTGGRPQGIYYELNPLYFGK